MDAARASSTFALGTFHNEHAGFEGLGIVSALAVAIFFFWLWNGPVSVVGANVRYPPKSKMGMLELIRVFASKKLPFQMLQQGRELGYSTFRLPLWIPGCPMVVQIGDYDLARRISKDPNSARASPLFKSIEFGMGGASLLTRNGKKCMFWKSRRVPLNAAFSSSKLRGLNKLIDATVDKWMGNTVQEMARDGISFDVSRQVQNLAISVLHEWAFGFALNDPTKRDQLLFDERLFLDEYFTKSFANPLRNILGPLLPERRRARQATIRFLGHCKKIIQANRQKPSEGTIIDIVTNNPIYRDDNDRARDLMIFTVAGQDSMAHATSFALLEIARDPGLQRCLRRDLASKDPKDSELLHYVIKESMRLYPQAPYGLGSRFVGSDFTFVQEDGKTSFIPKGSLAVMSQISIFRNTEVFEESDFFQPSRWDKPSEAEKASFFPFGLGLQDCIGQRMAMAFIESVVSRVLLSSYELKLVHEGPIEFSASLHQVGTMLSLHQVSK